MIFDAINENLPEVVEKFGASDSRKIFADEYIDDKTFRIKPYPTVEKYDLERIMSNDEPSVVGVAAVSVLIILGFMFGMYQGIMNKLDAIASMVTTVREVYIYTEHKEEPEVIEESIETEANIVEMPVARSIEYTPQDISYDFDILQPCGYTEEELLYCVSDEYRSDMAPHISTLLEAEERYGVNAFYLLCKLGLESGWGKYTSGYYNLGGWTNGDGSYMDFDSYDECIFYIAEKLSTEYREISGTRLADVCGRYCPYDGYSETLMEIMEGRKEKIEECA